MVCELQLNRIITEISKEKILICSFPYQRLLLVSHHPEIKPKLLGSPQKKSPLTIWFLPYFSGLSFTPLDKHLNPETQSFSCSGRHHAAAATGTQAFAFVLLPPGTPVPCSPPDKCRFILRDPRWASPLPVKPFPIFPEIAFLTSGLPQHSVYSLSWCLSYFILITCLCSTFPASLDHGYFKDRIFVLFIFIPFSPPHSHNTSLNKYRERERCTVRTMCSLVSNP